jgi:3-phenylpropionate/trans-cinnamate dioxygenase ferredoxin reductase subunit
MASTDNNGVVVAGGGLAAVRVAERLRRLGHADRITLLCAEEEPPYDRPPLSKSLLTQRERPAAPVPLRKSSYADLAADIRLGTRAERLDAATTTVHLSDGTELGYRELVVATGARAREISAFAGVTGVATLRTWKDCLRLRHHLRESRRVVIVGAGVLGCEVASAACALGVDVDLVEALEQPMQRVVGPVIGAVVADLHARHGVRLHRATAVRHLHTVDGRVRGVELGDGHVLDTDLVVVAVGSAPNTEWLQGSGVDVDDGVLVDRSGRTNLDGVFAVGDVARMPHPGGKGTFRLEHWTAAGDLAAVVASNVLARPRAVAELRQVPYFWSDQHAVKIQCLGLPSPDDDATVVEGAFDDGAFLALYSRDGRVTGAATIGRPAGLTRCRSAVESGEMLSDVRAASPWVRQHARVGVGSRA